MVVCLMRLKYQYSVLLSEEEKVNLLKHLYQNLESTGGKKTKKIMAQLKYDSIIFMIPK